MKHFARIAALLLTMPGAAQALTAQIIIDHPTPQARFGVAEVEAALRARHFEVVNQAGKPPAALNGGRNVVVRFMNVSGRTNPVSGNPEMLQAVKRLRPEGFVLRRAGAADLWSFTVLSTDGAGAMYGALELAEQIRARGLDGVLDTDRNPYFALRGTKFNIPLDLRTPSYSDMSDSAQANIDTVWDFEFWRAYLDQLARDRYNYVALWNLHPFPSLVKVPGYEDIALDDVWRSKARFNEDYSTRTNDIVTPQMLADREVVRQLTIAQKIDFWRRVMRYAKDRNIDFYVVTWNVYTYGTGGRHGITDALDNPKTVDYFRASVRELFHTYPLLAGIGVTAGENMGDISGDAAFHAKEDWLMATYGQGVLDAARAQPQRRFRFIHRQHETRAQDIATTFKPVIDQPNVDFVFSFKYAQAHALSSTTQTFHREFVQSLGDLKTLWTIRNDDALMLRWAAPDFVREFVQNIPYEPTQGYYVGSDMWVWGREFLESSASSTAPRQLEIDKHWLHVLLWGRFAYDPTLDDARIAALVARRFPGVDGGELLAAWQHASMIYPLVTGFHWANYDFQWYIEACRSRPEPARTASGFHSVETFITQPVHPGTDDIPIPQYVAAVAGDGRMPRGTIPQQVAQRIDAQADAALVALARFERAPLAGRNAEYASTLADIHAMALLGKYYAAKIRGATHLALFRTTRDPQQQAAAVSELARAADFWKDYSARMASRYRNPLWTNRVGIVDWKELSIEVQRDIEIARAPLP